MSFYNADPRAYFNIYADVTWDSVWGKQEESPSENLTWKNTIDNYEIGRLIRIKNGESKSSADYNNQIFVVEYGKNDIIYNKENNTSVEQSNHKYLKPLDLTNPYSMAIGEGTKANADNQTVVGKNNTDNDNALFIVGNGSGTGQTPTANAFEVLDGSSDNNTGIKINGKTLKINSQGTLVVNGADYPSGNGSITIVDGVKFSQTSSGTQEIGKLLKTNGDEWDYGSIMLPTTITKDTTFNKSVTITGTTTTAELTLGTHPIIILTQNDYDDLSSIDSNTLYIVIPNSSSST